MRQAPIRSCSTIFRRSDCRAPSPSCSSASSSAWGSAATSAARCSVTSSGWEPTQLGPLVIRDWQWVLIATGAVGLLVALSLFLLPEPPRRGKVTKGRSLPIQDVLREIHSRGGVYYPLFLGLAISSLEAGGLQAWRTPFMMRTYGWSPERDRRVERNYLLHRLPARRALRHLAHRISSPSAARTRRCGPPLMSLRSAFPSRSPRP